MGYRINKALANAMDLIQGVKARFPAISSVSRPVITQPETPVSAPAAARELTPTEKHQQRVSNFLEGIVDSDELQVGFLYSEASSMDSGKALGVLLKITAISGTPLHSIWPNQNAMAHLDKGLQNLPDGKFKTRAYLTVVENIIPTVGLDKFFSIHDKSIRGNFEHVDATEQKFPFVRSILRLIQKDKLPAPGCIEDFRAELRDIAIANIFQAAAEASKDTQRVVNANIYILDYLVKDGDPVKHIDDETSGARLLSIKASTESNDQLLVLCTSVKPPYSHCPVTITPEFISASKDVLVSALQVKTASFENPIPKLTALKLDEMCDELNHK